MHCFVSFMAGLKKLSCCNMKNPKSGLGAKFDSQCICVFRLSLTLLKSHLQCVLSHSQFEAMLRVMRDKLWGNYSQMFFSFFSFFFLLLTAPRNSRQNGPAHVIDVFHVLPHVTAPDGVFKPHFSISNNFQYFLSPPPKTQFTNHADTYSMIQNTRKRMGKKKRKKRKAQRGEKDSFRKRWSRDSMYRRTRPPSAPKGPKGPPSRPARSSPDRPHLDTGRCFSFHI